MDKILDKLLPSFRHFLDTETNSLEGRINLFGGILMFLIFIASLVPSAIEMIVKIFIPDYDVGLPWYANVGVIIIIGIYFANCVKTLSAIINKKNNLMELEKGSK